ncbi:MAG: hypothetical protein Q8N53_09185 [Longimicrobiales bacterium]|nr:hypothetical protein [Longimicrobiales bacterium]
MHRVPLIRVHALSHAPLRGSARHVLYWMVARKLRLEAYLERWGTPALPERGGSAA